ncbi:MAG: cold shock domain-containing protein [Prosthecobacter sp.]|nr:cold shock domain-containing protein [Prosthecobacter sp.]
MFGLFAGLAAVPLVKVPEVQVASFPMRGSEPCTLKWFNRVRGFGIMQGELSGHTIFINKSCFEKAGLGTPQLGTRYYVGWELKPHKNGPMAYEVAQW